MARVTKTLLLQHNENVLLCTLQCLPKGTAIQQLVHEPRGRAEGKSVVTSARCCCFPALGCSPVPARHRCRLPCSRCSDGRATGIGKSPQEDGFNCALRAACATPYAIMPYPACSVLSPYCEKKWYFLEEMLEKTF